MYCLWRLRTEKNLAVYLRRMPRLLATSLQAASSAQLMYNTMSIPNPFNYIATYYVFFPPIPSNSTHTWQSIIMISTPLHELKPILSLLQMDMKSVGSLYYENFVSADTKHWIIHPVITRKNVYSRRGFVPFFSKQISISALYDDNV